MQFGCTLYNFQYSHYSMEAREAHNAVLRKICHQLQSTLASLQEERASLQNILDHLLCID